MPDDIDEVSERLGEIAEQLEYQKDRIDYACNEIDKLSTVDPEDYEEHKEEFEDVEQKVRKHKWYWRGLWTVMGGLAFTLTLVWDQIVHLFKR